MLRGSSLQSHKAGRISFLLQLALDLIYKIRSFWLVKSEINIFSFTLKDYAQWNQFDASAGTESAKMDESHN